MNYILMKEKKTLKEDDYLTLLTEDRTNTGYDPS